jgi:hypothetical protein
MTLVVELDNSNWARKCRLCGTINAKLTRLSFPESFLMRQYLAKRFGYNWSRLSPGREMFQAIKERGPCRRSYSADGER